jgi:hypothetical protein
MFRRRTRVSNPFFGLSGAVVLPEKVIPPSVLTSSTGFHEMKKSVLFICTHNSFDFL